MTFQSSGQGLWAFSNLGHPFFRPRWRPNIVGVIFDAAFDWAEIAELVTDSYCLLAPKKLVAMVARPTGNPRSTDAQPIVGRDSRRRAPNAHTAPDQVLRARSALLGGTERDSSVTTWKERGGTKRSSSESGSRKATCSVDRRRHTERLLRTLATASGIARGSGVRRPPGIPYHSTPTGLSARAEVPFWDRANVA